MAVLNPFKEALVAFKNSVHNNRIERAKKLLSEDYSVTKKPKKDNK